MTAPQPEPYTCAHRGGSQLSKPAELQVTPASAEPDQQPAAPRPVLSRDQFQQLCLEGSSPATGSRVQQPTFVPLSDDEAPQAGMLLGLDAEFVALSQPDRRIIGCVHHLFYCQSCYRTCLQTADRPCRYSALWSG